MKLTKQKITLFTALKLPLVWLSGIRVKSISNDACTVSVKHRWINQNPFKSMFWAVQGMAAELSTGVLLMKQISDSNAHISMLVINNKANFSKKAVKRITFNCEDGQIVKEAIDLAIKTGEGQTLWLQSTGLDEEGDTVSVFDFEWSIRVKE